MVKWILLAVGGWMIAQTALQACSWGLPIWSKHKDSDTPLFRFVVDGKGGYIDASGRVIIPAKIPNKSDEILDNTGYDDFYGGVAEITAYRSEFINSSGTPAVPSYLAIKRKFDAARAFSEGLAAVEQKGKWGYVDHAGKVVIPFNFISAGQFSEGVAWVVIDGPCKERAFGPCSWPSILGTPEGKKPAFKYKDCGHMLIDRQGNFLSQRHFKDAFNFSEGLAAVGNGDRWGFIDKTGVLEIPQIYEAVGSFSDGLAKFQRAGKWGFLDRGAHVAITPQFDDAEDFSDGAAVVGHLFHDAWFIDKSGNRLFGKTFDAASTFRFGIAHVKNGRNDMAYIDRSGKTVFAYHPNSQ